jgi:hypothetical protein
VQVKGKGMFVRAAGPQVRDVEAWPPVAAARRRDADASSRSEMVFPSSLGTLRSPNNFRRQRRDFRDVDSAPWMSFDSPNCPECPIR